MNASTATFARLGSLLLLAGAGLLAACASTLPAANDEDALPAPGAKAPPLAVPRSLLSKRSLAARTGSTPSFYADTPGRRTYGILGVIAMMREGNRLVEAYGLEDPASQLSGHLVKSLADRNSMRTSTQEAADLLLDVQTINWDFRPYRNNPDSLYVVYSARISLVDRRAGTVLASGRCRSRRDSVGDSATLDQLLADGARRLQNELREAAQECAERLKTDTLNALLNDIAPVVAQQGSFPEPAGTIR